jgi:hypothetical protein
MGSMVGTQGKVVPEPRSLWRRGWVRAVAIVVLVVGMGLLIAAEYVARHMEPLLRHAVIDSLEDRFHEPVELDSLTVSVVRGLEVQGHGLRLLPAPDVHRPIVRIDEFSFHATMDDLLHRRARVETIHVRGIELHIPPRSMHTVVMGKASKSAIKLAVGQIVCNDALLVIDTDKPGKQPMEFQINNLVLKDFGANKPFAYEANLINPKPVGQIHAFGNFGPWNAESPRDTALSGQYTFSHADLGTIKGIKGTLDSTGQFVGVLGNITVDGTTNTPDFALEGRGRGLPLRTTFHAIVDGTTGDTTLAPVQAVLGSSSFTASGTVARVALRPGEEANVGTRQNLGHDIALTMNMPHGRIEDMLNLAVKADQPIMRGAMTMQAKLHIPPGPVSVVDKLQLTGTVTIRGVEFTSKGLQDKVDGLSMRAQGKPQEVKEAAHDNTPEVASQMTVQFVMSGGMLKAESLQYELPGAHVQMVGVYVMDRRTFEFDGHVRTDAKASEMVTGWKSALLKPFDGIFAKNGAGLELPISVNGSGGNYTFGLHESKLTADQMAAQMGGSKK